MYIVPYIELENIQCCHGNITHRFFLMRIKIRRIKIGEVNIIINFCSSMEVSPTIIEWKIMNKSQNIATSINNQCINNKVLFFKITIIKIAYKSSYLIARNMVYNIFFQKPKKVIIFDSTHSHYSFLKFETNVSLFIWK